MRIVVHMLLDAEHTVLCFQHHADFDIQRFVFFSLCRIVSVLHELALPRIIVGSIHMLLNILGIEVFQQIEFTCHIDHRTAVPIFVDHHQRRYAACFCHTVVIRTESRSDMYDTRTIFHRHIVAGDYPESTFSRIDPRDQLLVMHAGQFRSFPFADHFERHQFIARFIIGQSQIGGFRIEIHIQQVLSQNSRHRHTCIWIIGLNSHISEIWTHTKSRVGRQSPRSSGPCQEERFAKSRHLRFRIENAELSRTSRILHVAITPRLVQLMRAKPRSGSRRIRLDRVPFVKQTFLIQFLQQVPQCFDITIVVSDIRVFKVDPISHLLCQIRPFLRELHHVAAAGGIIFGHRDLFADIFFGDTQCFFNSQLYWKSVCIPSRLTVDKISFHGLITAENILNRTGNHMVNTGHTVCRRRTFIKDKRGMSFADFKTLMEDVAILPFLQHLFIDVRQVKFRVFGKFLTHMRYIYLSSQKLPQR